MHTPLPRRLRCAIQACAIIGLAAAALLTFTPKASAQVFFCANQIGYIVSMNASGQPTLFADYTYPSIYGEYAFDIDGMAFDPSGNLYVGARFYTGASTSASYIIKITPTGVQSTYESLGSADAPGALAFDSAGDLYMTSTASSGSIVKITPSGATSTLASNLGGLNYMAVDAADNVYVAREAGNDTDGVLKISPTGTVSTVASLVEPLGVSLDPSGNLFVTYGNDTRSLIKIAPDGTQTTLTSDLGDAKSDYVDASDNVYISDYTQALIQEYSSSGVLTNFSQGLEMPDDIIAPSPANPIEVSVKPSPAAGGLKTTGTITLRQPATATTHVRLSSSDKAVATVPVSVTVKVGEYSADFNIATVASTSVGFSTLIATTGGKSQSALVEVAPTVLASLSVQPTHITGGESATGTIKLNGPAPSGGASVVLTDQNSVDEYPAKVEIPAGQQTGTFTITTMSSSNSYTPRIVASYNGVQKFVIIHIAP